MNIKGWNILKGLDIQSKIAYFICLFWHWLFLMPAIIYNWLTIQAFRLDIILFSSLMSFCWYVFLLGIDEATEIERRVGEDK